MQHLVAPNVAAQDADLVSAMLTAIRNFVEDSFNVKQGDSLDSLREVLLFGLSKVLRQYLQELLEEMRLKN